MRGRVDCLSLGRTSGALRLGLICLMACGDSSGGDSSPDVSADATDVPSELNPDSPSPLLCEQAHLPLEPTPTQPVSYDSWTRIACLSDACLCSSPADAFVGGLLRCEAIQSGFYWGFGQVGVRVVGRDDEDACAMDLVSELEGSAVLSHCRFPLPSSAWAGLSASYEVENDFLDGFPGDCEVIDNCCLLEGCPSPCGEAHADWPFCFETALGSTPCP